jgi:8-oxo-dGTP pyrophosphatase MutT (NUDIX family)
MHVEPDLVSFMTNGPERLSLQSGVLPLIGEGVMLITSRKSRRWIIPKGNVENGMSPADSAAKEAWEEAGITGRILYEEIGVYSYSRASGLYSVRVYPFEVETVLDDWQEKHLRQRRIVTPAEAVEMLFPDTLKHLVAGYFARRIEK